MGTQRLENSLETNINYNIFDIPTKTQRENQGKIYFSIEPIQ